MRFSARLQFWFFQHYWWVLTLLLLSTLALLLWRNETVTTVATVSGVLLSLFYFVQKQKLEELRLFRELFKEFNERYDGMNEKLAHIIESKESNVSAYERETLIDYFNLCGEEYLYVQLGYIHPEVWSAWYSGMKAIVAVPRVQCVWLAEKETESYYGLPL